MTRILPAIIALLFCAFDCMPSAVHAEQKEGVSAEWDHTV